MAATATLASVTEAQAKEAIAQRFLDAWPTASGSVAFALVNEPQPSATEFAQLQYLPGSRPRISQGVTVDYQQHVWIVVQIWTPAGAGDKRANVLSDAARTVFEKQNITVGSEEITIDAGFPRGIAQDGRWYATAVQFDAYFYESR